MTGWEVVTWVLVACSVTLNTIIWGRQRRQDQAIRKCPGHQVGDTVRFVHDDGTAFQISFGNRGREVSKWTTWQAQPGLDHEEKP